MPFKGYCHPFGIFEQIIPTTCLDYANYSDLQSYLLKFSNMTACWLKLQLHVVSVTHEAHSIFYYEFNIQANWFTRSFVTILCFFCKLSDYFYINIFSVYSQKEKQILFVITFKRKYFRQHLLPFNDSFVYIAVGRRVGFRNEFDINSFS